MKKFLHFAYLASIIIALFSLTGCIELTPQHGIAFSPDGKALIVMDRKQDGIIHWDIASGDHKVLHKSAEGFHVLAIFWQKEPNLILFAEENSEACRSDRDTFTLYFKKLDPETQKKEVMMKEKLRCSIRINDADDEDEIWTPFSISYNYHTGTLSIDNMFFQADKPENRTAKFLNDYVKRKSSKNTEFGNFVFSPNGKYVAFILLTPRKGYQIKIMNLDNKKVETVYSVSIPRTDDDTDDWLVFSFFDFIKWNPNNSALYFVSYEGRDAFLYHYDLHSRKTMKIFKEQVAFFEPYPDGDHLFIFFARNESPLVSIIRSDGTVEDTYAPPLPEWIPRSIKVNPDENYAAVLIGINVLLPALFNLKEHKDEILVHNEDDLVTAGDIYFIQAHYEHALSYYEKANSLTADIRLFITNYHLNRKNEKDEAHDKILNELAKKTTDPFMVLGLILYSQDEHELAAAEFMQSTTKYRGISHLILAEIYSSENTDLSISNYEKALTIFKSQGCYGETLKDCPTMKDVTDELDELDEEFDYDPNLNESISPKRAPLMLAYSYSNKGKLEEAVKLLESIKTDYQQTEKNHYMEIHLELAELYEKTKQCSKALAQYKEVSAWQLKQPRKWRKENSYQIDNVRTAISRLKNKCR
ncbi:MAG: hypothetical protein AB1546_03245 [bacterium]